MRNIQKNKKISSVFYNIKPGYYNHVVNFPYLIKRNLSPGNNKYAKDTFKIGKAFIDEYICNLRLTRLNELKFHLKINFKK